jgi:pilus assembly protein Flp/PilA
VTRNFIRRLLNDRNGATAIEYGLILSLIVLGMLAALQAMASSNAELWGTVASRTEEAVTAATAG